MAKTGARQSFVTVLRKEMSRQKLGYRTIARKIVGPEASLEQVDNLRGQVRDWATGKHLPSRGNRRRVAVALGLPESTFDDQEEDLASVIAQQTERTVRRMLRERDGVA